MYLLGRIQENKLLYSIERKRQEIKKLDTHKR